MFKRLPAVLALLLAAGLVFAGGNREQDETDEDARVQEGQADPADVAPGTPIGAESSDRVVARVNGVGILREEYETAVNQSRQTYAMQGQQISDAELGEFRQAVLDQLIARELIYQRALQQGVEPGAEQIDAQLEQMRSQFDTDEAWQQALETNNVTEAELRDQLERQSLIQTLVSQAVPQSFDVAESEIQTFYDENPQVFEQSAQIAARHILIDTRELSEEADIEDARQRAEALRQELIDGADFAALAQEWSEGPSAPRGGDLGTFGRGQMVAPFEEVAFALEVGEISEIVQTQFGFHVIQVTERIEGGVSPLEDVTADIRQYLNQRKREEALQSFIDGLREEAEVEVLG